MKSLNPSLKLLINLSKILTESSRRFSGGLDGLGFNEFIILLHLENAKKGRMRRIDLAEKIGITASGITRLLAPMEKIGLVKKESAERDARVRYVALTESGKRNLAETMDRAKQLAEKIFPASHLKKLDGLSGLLVELGGEIR